MKSIKKIISLNSAWKNYFLLFTTAVFVLLVFEPVAYGQVPVDKIKKVDHWRVFKGIKKPPQKWNHLGFKDSTWLRGHGKFGYGRSGLDTQLNDMRNKYKRIYVRSEFAVTSWRTVSKMNLSVVCDGPFIAYLNGIEVIRNSYKTLESIDISGFTHELLPGKNIISIECSNNEISRNSFYFYPILEIHED